MLEKIDVYRFQKRFDLGTVIQIRVFELNPDPTLEKPRIRISHPDFKCDIYLYAKVPFD